jgi:anti-sigma-K factor RskA
MCPEREILSAYVDGELSKEETQAVTVHLKGCPHCARVVSRYRKVQGQLRDETIDAFFQESDIESIKHRIAIELERYQRTPHPFWHRKVGIPWVAAAASFAFILGGIFSYALLRPKSLASMSFLESHPSLNVTINVKNMKQLLDILNSQQGIREITIQLPESPQFEFRSEPVFIRASEYNRSTFR